MHTQPYRHWNLARLLSQLEQLGHLTADAQAHALGDIVTPGKLTRMLWGCHIPSLFARAGTRLRCRRDGWTNHIWLPTT
ncbi:hypothetical protein [Luteibacter sp. CQ10]|uniref:hypothetical protein n=1 Tax=Luteibacter sp. CQ10 TaxID=2805821 RepID=UPI0034A2B99C